MAPRLFRVIIPVAEIERGAEFYSSLLEMPGERVSSDRHYFDCGGTILACAQPFDHATEQPIAEEAFRPNPDHIYLSVPDVDAMRAHALGVDGATVSSEVEMQPWGERSFYVTDPFGNQLCFVAAGTEFTSGFVP